VSAVIDIYVPLNVVPPASAKHGTRATGAETGIDIERRLQLSCDLRATAAFLETRSQSHLLMFIDGAFHRQTHLHLRRQQRAGRPLWKLALNTARRGIPGYIALYLNLPEKHQHRWRTGAGGGGDRRLLRGLNRGEARHVTSRNEIIGATANVANSVRGQHRKTILTSTLGGQHGFRATAADITPLRAPEKHYGGITRGSDLGRGHVWATSPPVATCFFQLFWPEGFRCPHHQKNRENSRSHRFDGRHHRSQSQ
jgi:hypothetical protein